MDNEQNLLNIKSNKKGKKIIITVLVLIILGLVGYFVYDKVIKNSDIDKNKEEEETEYTNLNPELKNVLTFNISKDVSANSKLVAVTKDGKEILLADLTEYNACASYDFYNDKIYLYLHKRTIGKQVNGVTIIQPVDDIYLAYIDLNKGNGNYKINIIREIKDDGSIENIAATSDALYFVSSEDMIVKKYSLTDNKFEDTNIIGKDMIVKLDSTKDGSDYLVYNIGWDLYLLDTSTNETKLVENNCILSFVYNGKIVYFKYGKTGYAKVTYYDYDITTGEKEILSPEVGFGIASIDTENIMPYKDDYIYFTDYKVMSYNKGDYKELLDYKDAGFKYFPTIRGRVSEGVIYLGFLRGLTEEKPDSDALKMKTMDLENKNVEDAPLDYDYRYTKYYEQKMKSND